MMNGLAIGDFEFEHVGHNSHPAASVFPTVIGLSTLLEPDADDLLAALTVGYEVASRIGRASTGEAESVRGFHNPGLNGTLGAAAAAARLLGLTTDGTASALGIAASSSAGLMAFSGSSAHTKRLHPARAGQLGMEAALMSASGVTGPRDVLENPLGFFHAFSPEPAVDQVASGLGSEWLGTQMIVKLAPVHGHALPFVHAIDAHFGTRPRPEANDIGSVVVRGGKAALQDRHMHSRPNSLVEAQYSVRYSIAVALVTDLAAHPLLFDGQLARSSEVADLAERIDFELDPSLPFGGTVAIDGHEEIEARAYPFPDSPDELWKLVDNKFDRVADGVLDQEARDAVRSSITTVDLPALTTAIASRSA